MLTKVNSLAGSASTSSLSGSIMMHHSRDTAHKQWAETQVLILTGVARYVCVYITVCLSVHLSALYLSVFTFVLCVYITNLVLLQCLFKTHFHIRLFQSRKNALSTLDCFYNIWTTFLDYIKVCACNCTEEVSIFNFWIFQRISLLLK